MGAYHPEIVHFAIALLFVGVALRAVSLLGRPAFVSPAAVMLLALGTAAVLLAASSGESAHGPVERMPGARPAVQEHEKWGGRTHDVFIAVIVLEALAFLFRSPNKRYVHIASTAVGLVGLLCLYETAQHGGRLVYGYAGGVGARSGNPADVERLLLAGLYQQALVERRAGRPAEAAALLAQAGQRYRDMPDVQLAAAESLLVDRHDPPGALAALRQIVPPKDNRALRIQHGMLTADALEAAGQKDGAAAVLQGLLTEFPAMQRIKARIEMLKSSTPPSR